MIKRNGIPSGSWLDHVLHGKQLLYADNSAVPRYVLGTSGTPMLIAGLDNGSDAIKISMMHADRPVLSLSSVITAHCASQKCVAKNMESWRVDGSAPFSIGEMALARGGQTFPVGSTWERLNNQHFQPFLGAVLVKALQQAGYAPGHYQMCVGLGVRNEEMSVTGPDPQTQRALRLLNGRTYQVNWRDEWGNEPQWGVTLASVIPLCPTIGTFYSWYSAMDGISVIPEMELITLLDISGWHVCDFDISIYSDADAPFNLTASYKDIGDGTIALARRLRDELRQRYGGNPLTGEQAQQVLISGMFARSGEYVDVSDVVANVIEQGSEDILAPMIEPLADIQSFVICTGGGAILLNDVLHKTIQQIDRTEVMVMPSKIAAHSNSIGLFAQALWATLGSRTCKA